MELETIKIITDFKWLAINKCKSIEDAEDLIQDVFVRLLQNKKINSLPKGEKKKYIAACIHNMSVDFYRKRTAKKNGDPLPIIDEYLDYRRHQRAEAYSKIELKEVMEKCKGKETCDTLLAMASGYKAAELSGITGVPINTILGRCRYARKYLSA